MNIVDYKGISNQLETAVRAETKQAISTLFQVDAKMKDYIVNLKKNTRIS